MDRPPFVLLVDAPGGPRDALVAQLRELGAAFAVADTPDEGLARAGSGDVDVVLAEIALDGFDLLARARGRGLAAPVVLISEQVTVELAVQALHGGAFDVLRRPPEAESLGMVLQRATHQRRAHPVELTPSAAATPGGLVGASNAMVAVYRVLARAARTAAPVLITGESGTGKELVAQAVHGYSSRRPRPLVAVNCGALSETLLESELFGHVRGAFTGAERTRRGLVAEADGGTLFLDEIGEISPRLQVQLLRVLQSGEIRPVGSDTPQRVDVRVIAATHRQLERLVADGRFRQDLYYRLKVIEVRVPPLRERPDDIPMLVERFLRRGERTLTIDEDALTLLRSWPWPGNVRELENVVAQAVALSPGPTITVADLPRELRGEQAPASAPGGIWTLAEVERDYTRRILDRCGGNKSQAARLLGVDRKTLQRILAR